MEITEVRIKLMEDSDDRLQAFCSITFDNAFVIRDLKIIDGSNGPFVAMPSRKLTAHCPFCRAKNHLRAAYCNHCGKRLRDERAPRDAEGRAKLYADVAHPINPQCREMIQNRVIAEFEAELERAEQPGYVSRYDDDYEMDFEPDAEGLDAPPARPVETSSHPPLLRPPPREQAAAEIRPRAAAPNASAPEAGLSPGEGAGGSSHTAQPPEPEPRPPHGPPARVPREPRPAARPPRREFGAGIFEES